jgi:FkbM family methyltransferase
MANFFKRLGDDLFSKVNLNITRNLNGKAISVPLINGVRVGVSGEQWMSGVLREIFRYAPGGVFYDVGINLGQTLIKVMTLEENRKYVGFEPNPSCLFYIDHLVSANGWKSAVILPAGLADTDRLLRLYGHDSTDPESTIVEELKPDGPVVSKFVPVFRHDTIQGDFLDERVSVVKIDVEGAELEVVRSLQNLIERDRPIIIMEVLPNGQENPLKASRSRKMVETVKAFQYSFYRIIKTPDDRYAGIAAVDDVGDFRDPVMKDHVVLPNEQVKDIAAVLTMLEGNQRQGSHPLK